MQPSHPAHPASQAPTSPECPANLLLSEPAASHFPFAFPLPVRLPFHSVPVSIVTFYCLFLCIEYTAGKRGWSVKQLGNSSRPAPFIKKKFQINYIPFDWHLIVNKFWLFNFGFNYEFVKCLVFINFCLGLTSLEFLSFYNTLLLRIQLIFLHLYKHIHKGRANCKGNWRTRKFMISDKSTFSPLI